MDTDHLIKFPALDTSAFFTPLPEAVVEIERRRRDPVLMNRVREYLHNDIPEHFTYSKPIFYLSRHIATPNYETLRFVELTQHYDLPRVIGVDPKDKFFAGNPLKRALGKMPVTKGTARNGDEIIEHFTIVEFDKVDGHALDSITIKSGVSLQEFHTNLFREIYPGSVMMRNESAWVDRNCRGDLYNYYVRFLSLMVVHGVMLEFYERDEVEFVETILKPAIAEVTKVFGCRPLIGNLVEDTIALEKNWNSYPSVLYSLIKNTVAK